MTSFQDLGLRSQLTDAVAAEGYRTPTQIQAEAIPPLVAGRDLLGVAQTGTGKTAAFALPTLNRLLGAPAPRKGKRVRVLVLAPTRELVGQIAESFRTYAKHMDCVIETVFGGVKINRQIRAMERGADVLAATPGRLLDLMNQGAVRLDAVEVLILDEADQMLDLGFVKDLTQIIARVPKDRQTLLFSATMPKAIAKLAEAHLTDPVEVSITPESTTAERVEQGVLYVEKANKFRVLDAVLSGRDLQRTLVFTQTKHGANNLVRKLLAKGYSADALHGNKSQSQRIKALEAFRSGRCSILVATDIAARGIDIDDVSHVVNFELPNVAEQYVHRIGRTARAGRGGAAISLVSTEELYYLREIEKITKLKLQTLPAPDDCEGALASAPDKHTPVIKPKPPSRGGGGGGRKRTPKPGAGGRPKKPSGPQRPRRSAAAKPAGR